MMRLRSLLYVPADNARFIAKAHTRGADAVVLDLEDAVAPVHKQAARAGLAAAISSVGQAGAQVFVRINSKPEVMLADARAAHEGGAGGLLVAKASVDRLEALAAALTPLSQDRPPLALIPLLEDPAAVLEARAIARQPDVVALACGGEDLATALGAQPTPEVLRLPKQLVHYAAKAEGLMSLGLFRTVADYTDTDAIAAAAREARAHGFDGATCVHPGIVPVLNTAFSPSPEEIAWAERVVAGAQTAAHGAFTLDGQMIDEPVLARARRLLATI